MSVVKSTTSSHWNGRNFDHTLSSHRADSNSSVPSKVSSLPLHSARIKRRLAGPQWCQCWRFVFPVSHVGFSPLVFAGVLWCSLISLASFSVCERDDHQEPQQVPQPGEEGRLSHVTVQHDCGVLTARLTLARTFICTR